jgi:hypothetical protein
MLVVVEVRQKAEVKAVRPKVVAEGALESEDMSLARIDLTFYGANLGLAEEAKELWEGMAPFPTLDLVEVATVS